MLKRIHINAAIVKPHMIEDLPLLCTGVVTQETFLSMATLVEHHSNKSQPSHLTKTHISLTVRISVTCVVQNFVYRKSFLNTKNVIVTGSLSNVICVVQQHTGRHQPSLSTEDVTQRRSRLNVTRVIQHLLSHPTSLCTEDVTLGETIQT